MAGLLYLSDCAVMPIMWRYAARVAQSTISLEAGRLKSNAPLKETPWGNLEFAITDPDGNLVTFHEPVAA
jgi:hypothetical protein